MNKKYIYMLMALAAITQQAQALQVQAQRDTLTSQLRGQNIEDETVDVGADRTFRLSESTASAFVIQNKDIDHRSAKNIGYSLVGQGAGLITQEHQGIYGSTNASMMVRGLQSLSGSSPLILLDGIERSITDVSPEEVEQVTVLKDAAAVALYGYKGANGAVLITTKRGAYNSGNHVRVSYDHLFNFMPHRPDFVDAGTYADAINEAYANDGLEPRYTADEVAAFKNGTYPQYYPNVDWVSETFRKHGVTNKYGIEFTGGASKFRYYTLLNLLSDKGFIKNPDATDGYSTQDKYVKGNVRINLDMDLTPTTRMRVNLFGSLSEQSMPGSAADLWGMVYSVPSAAFPVSIYNEDAGKTVWGGSTTWAGTSNPVGQSTDAAYYKYHTRSLFADLTLSQDLSGFVRGLGASIRLGYDFSSTLYENYSRTYRYNVTTIPAEAWIDGVLDESAVTSQLFGKDTEMGDGAATKSFNRRFHFDGGFHYTHDFDERNSLYAQLKWDYEFSDYYATNATVYRQDVSLFAHYAYDKKYMADIALVESGTNKLAPGHKWSFSPTLSVAWVMSREPWMKNVRWIDFLKLRASAGIINLDVLPKDDSYWAYYLQGYSDNGPSYYFGSNYEASAGRSIGGLANTNSSHEKAYKYNVGIDARLFGGLNFTLDGFCQRRSDIWVSGAGAYSSIVAFGAPYINAGRVTQLGFETSLDYTRDLGQVTLSLGGNLSYSHSKINDMAEEPRAYANLVQTGNQLNQLYGLIALGFFEDEEDIAGSPTQTFSTVVPGDVKYKDVNGDNKIDENDKVAIGHTTTPNLYYQFHLGAEYRGLGFYALFQGTGIYSGMLNTKGFYWGLIGNSNISQYVYDNRWTPETASTALFPRLSSNSNDNNYQNSTLWLCDRSYLKLRTLEVYYNLPKAWLNALKVVNGAKIYLRGTDLLTFDHIDENDAEGYAAAQPLTKSLALGLKVSF
jgi:TonB-linked SusC/RagA family outer membrane protein